MGRAQLAATIALSACMLGASASVASADTTIADWQMDEPSGATTMLDSSGNGNDGTIGSAVQTGLKTIYGDTFYRFPSPYPSGAHPERLVTVNSSQLNPGDNDFAVTVRVRTGSGDQNVVQKGQASATGGYWKVDYVNGRAFCTFKGSQGLVGVGTTDQIWDARAFHTIRCERRSTGVSVIFDGGTPKTTTGPTGTIANTWATSIGGKSSCDGASVGCDYYQGDIDYVRVENLSPLPDSQKPVVKLTAPANGSTVTYGKTVNVTADASDNIAVAKVEFKVNGSLRCTVTAPPYTCPWTVWSAHGSTNTIRATAYDAAGNSASDVVTVTTS